ncbi:MAG: sodium-dependent transporter [Halieaceae bacterium]|jgi:NSS family neurotransmitter:Na+ symporter|nr:sodium-dependent transporter [Halieaceae bacterium]
MASARGEFSSRFGFIMAAAGSAVGLGNIWGFPTQAASNGGAAFLLVYLLLAFLLAYPALMAELVIGRHAHANAVTALRFISRGPATAGLGTVVGLAGITTVSMILSFYGIVAGWMIAHFFASFAEIAGLAGAANWLVDFSLVRNVLFMALFMVLTAGIIGEGVHDGIERWSSRLMPILIATLFLLVGYVLTLEGAMDGLKVYLLPDFSAAIKPQLIVSALGAAFFSLSLGAGTMLIYGSYIPDEGKLPALGGWVTGVDIMIAVTAGFVVLPAMYVALNNGVEIFAADGSLISGDSLIFTVLPALFDTMGTAGLVVSLLFFALMTIAALTSSISMLEVPVSYTIENHGLTRRRAVYIIGFTIGAVSTLILLNFEALFGLVIAATTRYAQPLLGLMFCLFCGWVWHRDGILQELRKGQPDIESGLFWAIWPWYIRFIVPGIILLIFANSLWG